MPASTKITFKVYLLGDKDTQFLFSKHKAETMEEGRTCVTQKKSNLSRKKNWTVHLKIRSYGLELKEIKSDYKKLTLENTSRYSSFIQVFKKEKQNSSSLLKHYTLFEEYINKSVLGCDTEKWIASENLSAR